MKKLFAAFSFLLLISATQVSCKKDFSFDVQTELEQIKHNIPAPWYDWSKEERIIAIGDSHTQGYGAGDPRSYPTILQSIIGIPVVNKGIGGQKSYEITPRLVKDTQDYGKPHVICVGQNNNWDWRRIMYDVDSMVRTLNHEKFLIIGLFTMDDPIDYLQDTVSKYDTPHNMNYWTTVYIDSLLDAKYPGHVISPMPYFLTKTDGSDGDKLDIYRRITPRSRRADIIHLNPLGNRELADTVSRKIIWKK